VSDKRSVGRPWRLSWPGASREALAVLGRPGIRVIAKQFGVGSGTVQRIAAAR
jgi:hypothetical protein